MFRRAWLLVALLMTMGIVVEDAYADGSYIFKGRVYRLAPFVDRAPRTGVEGVVKANLPNAMDLKDQQSVVKNQSERGACAYFSSTALLESVIKKYQGAEVNISEEYLIYYTKAILSHSPTSDGSFALSNLQAYQSHGFLLERDMPYQGSWFHKGMPCENYKEDKPNTPRYCYSHTAPVRSVNLEDRLVSAKSLQLGTIRNSSNAIVQTLAKEKQSVLINLPLHQDGWNAESGHATYNEQLRRDCKQNPDKCGGHSILLIGYNLQNQQFLFKNSWGGDWGKNGYGTLPFEYVDSYSQSNPVVGHLKSRIRLPDHPDFVPSTEIDEVKVVVDDDWKEGTEPLLGQKVTVNLEGKLKKMQNSVFYVSTYGVYKKPGTPESRAIGDDNSQMITVPKQYVEEFGNNLRGTYYRHFSDLEESIDVEIDPPALNMVPYRALETKLLKGKELFLRISAYYHNDIDGWKLLHRVYHPWRVLL
ncbi:MAG: C1 family peptidase [Oligoflexia bacterium]|nr:C1 family peptidase [Oligoflexia bacterium]